MHAVVVKSNYAQTVDAFDVLLLRNNSSHERCARSAIDVLGVVGLVSSVLGSGQSCGVAQMTHFDLSYVDDVTSLPGSNENHALCTCTW